MRKFAALPKQHVTSLFSCMIFIISPMAVKRTQSHHHWVLQFWTEFFRMMIRMSECVLTVGSAVSEERHQKRNVVNVLQMRTDLVDTTRKFGLKEGQTQTGEELNA